MAWGEKNRILTLNVKIEMFFFNGIKKSLFTREDFCLKQLATASDKLWSTAGQAGEGVAKHLL